MGAHAGERPEGNTFISECIVDDFNQRIITPFVTSNKFIITVDSSDTTGGTTTFPTSNSDQFILPAFGTGYTIEWYKKDDFQVRGSLEGNDETTITFPEPGTYIILVSGGTFDRIRFSSDDSRGNSYKDHNKVLEINQWGDIAWSSLVNAFRYNTRMKMPAKDIPNLTNATKTNGAFYNCSVFGAVDDITAIGSWDVSTITFFGGNSGRGLFGACSAFNQYINDWDVSNGTSMADMFRGATSFNQPLDKWDVGNVTTFFRAFENTPFNQPIGNWDVSNVRNMYAMFQRSSFNQDISNWDVSNVTSMGGTESSVPYFNGIFNISDFAQDISGWNVSSLQNAGSAFNASNLNSDLNQWNTQNLRNITRLGSSFNHSLENWDLSSMQFMGQLFDFTSISTENLSKTLVGWANFVYANNGPYNISLGANNKTINNTVYDAQGQYTNAVDAKAYLTDTVANGGSGWTITGATQV